MAEKKPQSHKKSVRSKNTHPSAGSLARSGSANRESSDPTRSRLHSGNIGLTSSDLARLQATVGNHALQYLIFRQQAQPANGQPAAPAISAVAQEVWDDNSNIHAQFGNDPAQFARQTRIQYESNPSIRHHFDGLDSDGLGYRRIYPSYFALGITDPAQWIRDNIRSVRFMGRTVPIHRDLDPSLTAIEANIRADPALVNAGTNAGIIRVGGFVPRRIRGGTNLSHHSVGRAVDLNSGTNLRFLDLVGFNSARVETLLKIIQAVTGVDLDSVTDYGSQKAASDNFRAGFGTWLENQKTWLNDFLKQDVVRITNLIKEYKDERQSLQNDRVRRAELNAQINELKTELNDARKLVADQKRWLRKVKGVKRATDRVVAIGFLDLNEHVVRHFQANGFEWGGEWSGVSKDFMHFQRGTVSQ